MEPLPLEAIASPPLFPDFVSCCAARLRGGDHRLHFAAGRECAARAMAALGIRPAPVERGPGGEPLWPAGVTGSITHKHEHVAAAVARTSDVRSVGIDVEEIVDADRAARIARIVVLPQEAALASDLPPGVGVSLIFSIKEALFKCLYPIVQTRFYYDALAVTALDLPARRFDVVLLTDLPEGFRRGATLTGACVVDDGRTFAGAWTEPPR